MNKLDGLRAQCAPLEALPTAPAAWREEVARLRDDEIKAQTQAQANRDQRAQILADHDAIVVDAAALGVAGRFEALAAAQARALTADKDLPSRHDERRELDLTIGRLLRQIGHDDDPEPQRFVLPPSLVERLRGLIETVSGLDAAKAQADGELDAARRRLAAAADALGGATPLRAAPTKRCSFGSRRPPMRCATAITPPVNVWLCARSKTAARRSPTLWPPWRPGAASRRPLSA